MRTLSALLLSCCLAAPAAFAAEETKTADAGHQHEQHTGKKCCHEKKKCKRHGKEDCCKKDKCKDGECKDGKCKKDCCKDKEEKAEHS